MGSPVQVTISKVLACCSHCKLLAPYTAGVIISIVEIEKVSILRRWDSIFEKQPSFSSQLVFFFFSLTLRIELSGPTLVK